jgi:hypothetical protein
MKRLARLAPLIFAAVLFACGGDDSAPSATRTAASDAAATPAEATSPPQASPTSAPPSTPAPSPTSGALQPRYLIYDLQTTTLLVPEDADHEQALAGVENIGPPASVPPAVSPDGAYVIEFVDGDGGTGTTVVILEANSRDEVWRIEGAAFNRVASPLEIWSADSTRVLLLIRFCTPEVGLVAFNVLDGSQQHLADGDFYHFIFSPDNLWVAATYATDGGIIPADGSGTLERVAENVHAPAKPGWSADSRYIAFREFFGGYGGCVA